LKSRRGTWQGVGEMEITVTASGGEKKRLNKNTPRKWAKVYR